jgi:hypothetical protein
MIKKFTFLLSFFAVAAVSFAAGNSEAVSASDGQLKPRCTIFTPMELGTYTLNVDLYPSHSRSSDNSEYMLWQTDSGLEVPAEQRLLLSFKSELKKKGYTIIPYYDSNRIHGRYDFDRNCKVNIGVNANTESIDSEREDNFNYQITNIKMKISDHSKIRGCSDSSEDSNLNGVDARDLISNGAKILVIEKKISAPNHKVKKGFISDTFTTTYFNRLAIRFGEVQVLEKSEFWNTHKLVNSVNLNISSQKLVYKYDEMSAITGCGLQALSGNGSCNTNFRNASDKRIYNQQALKNLIDSLNECH